MGEAHHYGEERGEEPNQNQNRDHSKSKKLTAFQFLDLEERHLARTLVVDAALERHEAHVTNSEPKAAALEGPTLLVSFWLQAAWELETLVDASWAVALGGSCWRRLHALEAVGSCWLDVASCYLAGLQWLVCPGGFRVMTSLEVRLCDMYRYETA